MTEATSLCGMIGKDGMDENHPDAHVVVPLMGRFKGERRTKCFVIDDLGNSDGDSHQAVDGGIGILMGEGRTQYRRTWSSPL